jgi:hypothetical protein
MFLMIFQSSMGPRKLRCDVHNGTTQGYSYPFDYWKDNYFHKFVLKNTTRKVWCNSLRYFIMQPWKWIKFTVISPPLPSLVKMVHYMV